MSRTFLDLVALVTDKLERAQIDYMVVGSVASSIYGEPRLTRDLDLVVEVTNLAAKKIVESFNHQRFYVPPFEILSQIFSERAFFNIYDNETGLKIDFTVRKQTEHAQEEIARKRKIDLAKGLSVFVAAPEDVIIKKLSYFREGQSQKHLQDIAGIVANSKIDQVYLQKWIEKLKLQDEWLQVNNG